MSASGPEALVLGGEVGVLGAGGGQGGFFEGPVQPLGALAGLARAAFAGRLVVAGALSGPGREFLGAREHRHVDADLGDDALGAAPLNARDAAQQLNGFFERGDLFSDRFGEAGDLFVEDVDMGEDRPTPIHTPWR